MYSTISKLLHPSLSADINGLSRNCSFKDVFVVGSERATGMSLKAALLNAEYAGIAASAKQQCKCTTDMT